MTKKISGNSIRKPILIVIMDNIGRIDAGLDEFFSNESLAIFKQNRITGAKIIFLTHTCHNSWVY